MEIDLRAALLSRDTSGLHFEPRYLTGCHEPGFAANMSAPT